MSWVVDASVAAKWFIEEELTDQARLVIETNRPLFAPDLILAEVSNVAWKRVRKREVMPDHARAVASALPEILSHVVSSLDVVESALDLALRLNHPVYDCLYLALAKARDIPLVTADTKLSQLIRRKKTDIDVIHLTSFVMPM